MDGHSLDSDGGDTITNGTGYALADLAWLELQFRLRHAVATANASVSTINSSDGCAGEVSDTSLAARFAGSGLTKVISDAEKLRRVRARRERYLEDRSEEARVDLILRLRSTGTTFTHIRSVESKGLSYWYLRTEEDYKENWFVRCSPMKRYYEEMSEKSVSEPDIQRISERHLALTSPVTMPREPRKQIKRIKTG